MWVCVHGGRFICGGKRRCALGPVPYDMPVYVEDEIEDVPHVQRWSQVVLRTGTIDAADQDSDVVWFAAVDRHACKGLGDKLRGPGGVRDDGVGDDAVVEVVKEAVRAKDNDVARTDDKGRPVDLTLNAFCGGGKHVRVRHPRVVPHGRCKPNQRRPRLLLRDPRGRSMCVAQRLLGSLGLALGRLPRLLCPPLRILLLPSLGPSLGPSLFPRRGGGGGKG